MWYRSFIPEKISDRRVVGFLDRLRRIGRSLRFGRTPYGNRRPWTGDPDIGEEKSVTGRKADSHVGEETSIIERRGEARAAGTGFLESQNSYGDIPFGKSDMAYAGCEIIAVYNALIALGARTDLGELIRTFERDGMVLSGRFGTSPLAIRDYFEKRRIRVDITYRESEYEALASRSEVLILTMYNDRHDIFKKIHTICITRDEKGYTAHNTYGDGRSIGPVPSFTKLYGSFGNGRSRGILLIGIEDPE